MGFSIRKPLGGKNSIVRRVASKPIPTLVGLQVGGPLGAAAGIGMTDMKADFSNKMGEYERQQQMAADQSAAANGDLEAMARLEEGKRQALGKQQQQQILGFADETATRGADFRKTLAERLASGGRDTFNLMNPSILEDLNSRGLFTSQTARDQEQGRTLKEIELANQGVLNNFDTSLFNEVSDIRGTGLSALLGGDQSALDSALELRKAGIQRRFDEADAAREQTFAEMLAKRKSRDQLTSDLLGGVFKIGSAFAGK